MHFKLTKVLAVWFRYSLGEIAALSLGESVVFSFLADEAELAGTSPNLMVLVFSVL